MAFDEQGKWSWDGMKERTQNQQSAAHHIGYRHGTWWVEEMLVFTDEGKQIGKLMTRTFMSPHAPDVPRPTVMSMLDERPDVPSEFQEFVDR